MSSEFFEGRVQLLHDTEEHWQQVANTFIPLPGEACVTLDDENKGRVKYGDGIHTWGELPYSNDGKYDDESLVSDNHVIQIKGYKDADNGQSPIKTGVGLEWFTPVRAVILGNDDAAVPTSDGHVVIPIAGERLGVVKQSDEVQISDSGEMYLKEVDANKVRYSEDESIREVLNRRTLWEQF